MLEPYVGFKVAIRRNWWRISSVKYVLKMKMKWALKVNFKTSTKWSASSRWAISKRFFAWLLPSIWWSWICKDATKKKLSHDGLWGSNPQDFIKQEALPSIWCSWICEDAPKKKLSHSGVWGSNSHDFIKQAQSRKAFHLLAVKTVIIELKWNTQD